MSIWIGTIKAHNDLSACSVLALSLYSQATVPQTVVTPPKLPKPWNVSSEPMKSLCHTGLPSSSSSSLGKQRAGTNTCSPTPTRFPCGTPRHVSHAALCHQLTLGLLSRFGLRYAAAEAWADSVNSAQPPDRRGLCSRGYLREFLRAVFREITSGRRARILEPKQKERNSHFFETYRACVLTLRNAPEWPALKSQLDLSLKELVESTYGDIFHPRVFLAQCNVPRLGSILKC
jgi:hypothetical protein